MPDLGLCPVLPGAVCRVAGGEMLALSLPPAKSAHDAYLDEYSDVEGEDDAAENDMDRSAGRLEAGQALGESPKWKAAQNVQVDCQSPTRGVPFERMCVKAQAQEMCSGAFIDSFSLKRFDKDLLRAARLSTVMAKNASVMKRGTIADWDVNWDWNKVSEPVVELDAFLSHNWCASRMTKFLQLALHFHWWPAVLSLFPAVLIGVALNFTRILPVLEFESQLSMCIGCEVVGLPTFLLVLIWWSQILGCCGCHKWSAKVFLDKYCVHQHDEDKKRRGIGLLPVSILQSKEILILANKDYFMRLFTVYEMASFLCTKERNRLHIMPEFLPKVVLAAYITYGCSGFSFNVLTCKATVHASMAAHMGEVIALWPYVTAVIAMIAIPFLYQILIRWATEDRDTQEKLRTFRIQDSQCCCEGDRAVVYHNVAAFEVACGSVDELATQEEALDSFNSRVQATLPDVIAKSGGGIGIPYRYVAIIFLISTLKAVDKVCAFVMQPSSWRGLTIEVLKCLADNFLVLPAMAVLLILVAKKAVCFQSQFWRQRVFSVGGVLTVIVIFYTLAAGSRLLAEMAVTSNIGLAMLIIVTALLAVFSICAFRRTDNARDSEAIARLKILVDHIAKENRARLWVEDA